jgi:hypothetical protein
MRKTLFSKASLISLFLIGALLLSSCNYPGYAAEATQAIATATETLGIPPSPMPTDTAEAPPTDTPEPPPPTDTVGPPPPTQAPPPTQVPPTATRAQITPMPGALFVGSFTGGDFTFRVHQNGWLVIPKTVTVRNAICKEGGKFSDHITFEPPPQFKVEDGKFTMTQGSQVVISGWFSSSTVASGTITIKIKKKGENCTIVSGFQAKAQ